MKHLLRIILWFGICLYLTLFVLLKTSAVQGYLASEVAEALEEKLGTEVSISNIDLRLMNRVVIDGLCIQDQSKKEMVRVTRLSASIDLLPLIVDGKISISSAQIFGMSANLYRQDAASPLNCQFMIDSLQSKDTTTHTPLDLRIASLIIRNSSVSYDQLDVPQRGNRFSPEHISISKLSSHLILHHLTDDSLHLQVKRLSMTEQSGIALQGLKSDIILAGKRLNVSETHVQLPGTTLSIPYLKAQCSPRDGETKSQALQLSTDINFNSLDCSDLSALLPQTTTGKIPVMAIRLMADSKDNNSRIHLTGNTLSSNDAAADISLVLHDILETSINGDADIKMLHASEGLLRNLASFLPIPDEVLRLGTIDINGKAQYASLQDATLTTEIKTSHAGSVKVNGGLRNHAFNAEIETPGVDLGRIIDDKQLGMLRCKVALNGTVDDKMLPQTATVKGNIKEIAYNHYAYSNISVNAGYAKQAIRGMVEVNDPCLQLRVNADMKGSSVNDMLGFIDIDNIYYRNPHKPEQNLSLNRVSLNATRQDDGKKNISLHSDLCDATLEGNMNLTTLPQSFIGILSRYLPNIPGIPQTKDTHNDFYLTAKIHDLARLKGIVDIPVTLSEPVTINGSMTASQGSMDMNINAPDLLVNDTRFSDTNLHLYAPGEDIRMDLATLLYDDNGTVQLGINCQGKNNDLHTTFSWDNMRQETFKGSVNTLTQFYPTMGGGSGYQISIPESFFQVADTLWCISSGNIIYDKERLSVEKFMIDNDTQRLTINGIVSKDISDTIAVELQDIDVSYILNLVNFHSVDFDGRATGRAVGCAVMGDMKASADLIVNHFLFQKGRMGDMHINAQYSNASEQIDISAVADDSPGMAKTIINGYVSPQRNHIDLDIEAQNTRLEFMQDFCSSFITDTDLNGDGRVRLHGPLNAINLEGSIVAHGGVTLISTNCRYTLDNDTVTFIPDDILFNKALLRDQYGNTAYLSGGIHHHNLGSLSYDLNATTKRFFAYNFPTMTEGSTFCGRAFIDGSIGVHGKGNELLISADCTALDGSYISYNASSPDAIKSQEFITWRSAEDVEDADDDFTIVDVDWDDDAISSSLNAGNNRTNIRMNFLVNATPAARLHLIMDENTGDYIDLFGSGVLRANYYNKGSFELFGNYAIDHGTYKMTIQNLIRRDFTFLKGGMISFGGDPYEANLNMQAQYTLNSVSLSDLNIGSSFKSNNVPVNCLMNITGRPSKPIVDFDLHLPTLGSDARQMVYSIINSEEEMTQQVLYLLAVGRFYAQNTQTSTDMQQVGQGTLAMQSFLSTTLSQQFNTIMNNVLGKVAGAKNWSFGANIAPGNEGMSNAEYEGLLSGQMLNNRLLFNGQFGYRDNIERNTQNFIGDFNIQYLLTPNGTLSLKAYNQSNDRYFTKSSLNTQGIGILIQKEFGK